MEHFSSAAKKSIAIAGVAIGVGGFGMSVGVGTAVADGTTPDTGTYDELLQIPDPDASQGDWDDDGIQAAVVVDSPNPR